MKIRLLTGAAVLLAISAGAAFVAQPAQAQYGGPGGWHNNVRFRGAIDSNAAPAIRWRGIVDDRAEVFIHRGDVHSQVVSGQGIQNETSQVQEPLPHAPVHVYLLRHGGRGQVYVFQQPRRDNGFTAGVRIYDPQPGSGDYRFALGWN